MDHMYSLKKIDKLITPFYRIVPFTKQSQLLATLNERLLKALWKKEEMLITNPIVLFPQCYLPFSCQLICFLQCLLTLCQIIPTFNDPEKEIFENMEGKGENAGTQHFLLFPQCFLPIQTTISVFKLLLCCCLQML